MTEPSTGQLSDSAILMDYLPKLVRLVDRNMAGRLRQKEGSDDMADSVLGSVLRMAKEGKLQIEQSEDFWKLLVVISLNKVRKKARYYKAQKRDSSREIVITDDMPRLEELAQSHSPTEEDGRDVTEFLSELTRRLDEDCQTVLAGKIDGLSNAQIAERLGPNGKSTKTVTRCWQKIETQMKQLAAELEL